MADWLLRARREIAQSAGRGTAEAAERSPTAVTAVLGPGDVEVSPASIGSNGSAPSENFQETALAIPGTAGEEAAIRAWLSRIAETDEATIADVLHQCRSDAQARDYFIGRAGEAPSPDDDRRRCDRCANLTERGLCLAARRGEIVAGRGYEPVRDLLRRCEGYAPGADDPDRRPGRERWPGLIEKGSDHANT